MVEVLVVT